MRISANELHALDLEVHSFLVGVPLHDVSAIDLPGGGPNRTISDIRALLSPENMVTSNILVRVLFALRSLLGQVFGWDRTAHSHAEESYAQHLTDSQRARSLVDPGTFEGPFQLVYVFPREALSEVRNATVHAFSCMALCCTTSGYRFYWAIYVRNVSRLTPVYMALIEPFRRFVVYPSILRRLRASWVAVYTRESEPSTA
jgi:hypothetical protein